MINKPTKLREFFVSTTKPSRVSIWTQSNPSDPSRGLKSSSMKNKTFEELMKLKSSSVVFTTEQLRREVLMQIAYPKYDAVCTSTVAVRATVDHIIASLFGCVVKFNADHIFASRDKNSVPSIVWISLFDHLVQEDYLTVIQKGFKSDNRKESKMTCYGVTPKLQFLVLNIQNVNRMKCDSNEAVEYLFSNNSDEKVIFVDKTNKNKSTVTEQEYKNILKNKLGFTDNRYKLAELTNAKKVMNLVNNLADKSVISYTGETGNINTENLCAFIKLYTEKYGYTRNYNSYQSLPHSVRNSITINNNKTVEIDFSCFHPNILYIKAGLTPPTTDAYSVSRYSRDVMKDAWMRLESGSSFHTACYDLLTNADSKNNEYGYEGIVKRLEALTEKHEPISHLFYKSEDFSDDTLINLMHTDGNMSLEILNRLAQQNIVCIPVHDSFRVEEQHVETLKQIMKDVYIEVLQQEGFDTSVIKSIPIKITYSDHTEVKSVITVTQQEQTTTESNQDNDNEEENNNKETTSNSQSEEKQPNRKRDITFNLISWGERGSNNISNIRGSTVKQKTKLKDNKGSSKPSEGQQDSL